MGVSDQIGQGFSAIRGSVNNTFAGTEPIKLIAFSVAAAWALKSINDARYGQHSLPESVKRWFFRWVRKLPAVKAKIAGEIAKTKADLRKDLLKPVPGEVNRTVLPEDPLSVKQILDETEFMVNMGDVDWKAGKVSGTVYHGGDELTEMVTQVFERFCWDNPLHADVFPGTRKMESEIIRMVANLFHGGPESCGTMTSGGTESIMMAVKAHRDHARAERGISHPNIVIPVTAHVAFDKAAHYLGVRVKHIAVDPVTGRANVNAMRRAVNGNTILVVGSAPSFPHGVIDDIASIAKIARDYGCGMHVDCCLGGFVLPFLNDAGYDRVPFDFRVEGVTSISVDTHKYGYCPKGTSVVLYASENLRHYQFHVQPDWPGGIYVSPTVAGSRPGSLVAATWATMMYFGHKGYVDSTRRIIQTRQKIQDEGNKIPGLHVVGEPESSVVAFASNEFDIYSFHLCVTYVHTAEGVAEAFVRDLQEVAAELMSEPDKKCTSGLGVIYGMASTIPDRSIVDTIACAYLDVIYECKPDAPALKQ